MPKVKIERGDTVSRLAESWGFAPETIWNDGGNEKLRGARDHMDVLLDGDVVMIPEKVTKAMSAQTNKRNSFKRKGVPMKLTLQVLDEFGLERKSKPYRLEIDGQEFSGTTTADGVVDHYIPNGAKIGKLFLEELELELTIGGLDPKGALDGVQQRLDSLGFHSQGDNGKLGFATRIALMQFQAMLGLDPTGEADDATVAELEKYHNEINKLSDAATQAAVSA